MTPSQGRMAPENRDKKGREAYMNRFEGCIPLKAGVWRERSFRKIFLAAFPLVFVFAGCAGVPKPVTIKHDKPLTRNAKASAQQNQKVQAAAAQVVIPESKKVTIAENAVLVPVQNGTVVPVVQAPESERTVKPTAADAQDIMKGIYEEIEKKIKEQLPREVSAAVKKEQTEKIEAGVVQALLKDLDEEVESKLKEELPRAMRAMEDERAGKIEATVRDEFGKSIPEQVRSAVNEWFSGEKATPLDMPEWTRRIRLSGDIRLRYEANRFNDSNELFAKPSNPGETLNTTVDQSYLKYRVRFGVEARVSDGLDAHLRLATGNTSNPVSTNSTFSDYLNKDSIVLDLAYLKWKPLDWVTVYGGRMPNPWFSTDLVWDSDLAFEGLAVTGKRPVSGPWSAFMTAGAFSLQQYDLSADGKWLVAGQLGLERKDSKGVGARLGAAYYDFSNITGVMNDPLYPSANDWTAPLFMQKGNTLFNINPLAASQSEYKLALASDFKELNLTGALDIGFWDPFHVVFLFDFVKNFGFDKEEVSQRNGNPDISEETTGYQLGVTLGYPAIKEASQWKADLNYKRLEGDAVVDAFTDSDFHLGGTNAQGWVVGTDYAFTKNSWLTLRWLSTNEISGPPLAIDVFQADITARF